MGDIMKLEEAKTFLTKHGYSLIKEADEYYDGHNDENTRWYELIESMEACIEGIKSVYKLNSDYDNMSKNKAMVKELIPEVIAGLQEIMEDERLK